MKTLSLANKYRPKFLKDLKGQEITVKFLSHLIKNDLSKNIIFKGEFGTGKTTSARIYARSMLCSARVNEVDACGVCTSCKSFDSGSSKDCLEFDAASKGSIDNIRQLLEAFNIPPIFSKKKIWIIDEAHSMSPKAWDTLLKTIEEPKDFQIILFCTNYPDKIRPAILSRCIILELKKLGISDSKDLIKKVCGDENIKIDNRSLNLISYISKGHSRDILKNLEQLSFLGDITEDMVFKVLIDNKYSSVLNIYKCLITQDFSLVLDEVFNSISDFKKEFDILLELIIYLKSYLLYTKKLDSLSVDKIFYEEELIKLSLNTDSFCKSSLISINDFFLRLDNLFLTTQINSNIEFKFLIFSICEALNKERLLINTKVLSTNSNKGRRIYNKEVKEIEKPPEIKEEIKEKNNEIEKTISIESPKEEKSKIYSHTLYSKYKFTRKIELADVIFL